MEHPERTLNNSTHHEGDHGMCGSFRKPASNTTIHHNIFATSRDRHPTLGGSRGPYWIIDFRNNVVYNWSAGRTANVSDAQTNLINNIFRPGRTEELHAAMDGVLCRTPPPSQEAGEGIRSVEKPPRKWLTPPPWGRRRYSLLHVADELVQLSACTDPPAAGRKDRAMNRRKLSRSKYLLCDPPAPA